MEQSKPDLGNPEEFFSAVHEQHMEKWASELTELQEWFQRDFPEATLRIESDWNKPAESMVLLLTLITGKEATPRNQGLKRIVRRVPWRHWNDPIWFGSLMTGFQNSLRQTIIDFMNDHYNLEKVKNDK